MSAGIARVRSPVLEADRLRRVQPPAPRGVEITGQYRYDVDADSGIADTVDLGIAKRGDPIERPVQEIVQTVASWDWEYQRKADEDDIADGKEQELTSVKALSTLVKDDALRHLPVGGTFKANPEGAEALLTMLEHGFGLRVSREGDRVYIESQRGGRAD